MSTINPGILLMLMVALIQTCYSGIVKGIAPHITTSIEVLTYYLVPLAVLLAYSSKSGFAHLKTRYMALYLLRGALTASAVFCFFYASRNMALGVASVLFNTTPIFVSLFSWLFIGEKISRQVILAIVISLIGVLFVINPKIGQFITPVSVIGLASGILMALSQVLLRYFAKIEEPVSRIVFYLYLFCAIVAGILVLFQYLFSDHAVVRIQAGDHTVFVFSMLLALGLLSLVGQRLLTKAFTYMPAGKLTPCLYVSVLTSGLTGFVIWGQKLYLNFLIGGILILIGIIMITFDRSKEAAYR